MWSSLLSSLPINDAPQREMAAGRNDAGLVDHQLRTIACAHIRSFTFFNVYTSSILLTPHSPPPPLPVNVLARARHRLHARTHVPSHGRTRAHATMRTPIPSRTTSEYITRVRFCRQKIISDLFLDLYIFFIKKTTSREDADGVPPPSITRCHLVRAATFSMCS